MRKKAALLFTVCSFAFALQAEAMDELAPLVEEMHRWAFDAPTIERGYTVSTPDEQFFVGVLPNVLKGETDVTIKVFDHAQSPQTAGEGAERLVLDWSVPEGKRIVSPIYEFDIKGAKDLYDPQRPLWLRFHYTSPTLQRKDVFFWDKGKQEWTMIPTTNDRASSSLRAAIHLTYAPMAILEDTVASEGEASWYAYKGCDCAASRDYPKGTLLKVTDLQTKKEVIVRVNDYGPEEWTGRIIDLDKVAFSQLTETWRGLTHVRVEPYNPL